MRWVLGLACVLLTSAQLGPAAAHQDATVTTTTACSVEPRPLDDLLSIWYGPDSDASFSSRQFRSEAELPQGEAADAATVAEIDAVAQEWAACLNAGDYARYYALLTDYLARSSAVQAGTPRDRVRAVVSRTPVPMPAGSEVAVGPAREVRVLADGRVGALFDLQRGGDTDVVFIVFEQQAGRWRLGSFADVATIAAIAPVLGYQVVNGYPHDRDAFTQGLVYLDGVLYEGTGLEGESTLRQVDLDTGEVLQSRALDEEHFGEGIAVVGDRIYQLTWRTGICFVYDRETFDLLATFSYPTEGWGLTTDGERLIMSDGSSRLTFRDPATFEEIGHVDVRDGGMEVDALNELEYVDGEVWANVYTTDYVVRIDPGTGSVTSWIDLTGLLSDEDRAGEEVNVLNGIAHDPASDRVFVTGKLWPRLFEIEVVPPASSG